jgi:hypothetical protein
VNFYRKIITSYGKLRFMEKKHIKMPVHRLLETAMLEGGGIGDQ